MADPSSRFARILKGIVKWLLIAAALLAVAYVAIDFLGGRKEKSVRARWTRDLQSIEAFQKALPETKKNAEAQALEALAEKMGLAQEESKPPWKDVKGPFTEYAKKELQRPSSEIEALPEAIATFLAAQHDTIVALRRQLIDGATPIWEEQRTNLYNAPLPRLLPIIDIQRLLAVDALSALQRGTPDQAGLDLEAGWRLQEAMSHRPELISAFIRMALIRFTAGVLRKSGAAPVLWKERLAALDPKADLVKGYTYEACALLEIGQPGQPPLRIEGTPMSRPLSAVWARPYVRLCAADSAGTLLDELTAVRDEDPCVQDLTARLDPIVKKTPWWNLIAKIAPPSLTGWTRGGRMRVDLELTGKILEARAARDRNGGVWPASIPGIEASACRGGRWTYAVSQDRMTLTYSKEIAPPSSQSLVLPLKHEEAAPPSAKTQVPR